MTDLLSSLRNPLKTPAHCPREQQRFIVFITVVGAVTALYHAILIILFLRMDLHLLALYNIFSVFVWVAAIWLAHRGQAYLPALLMGLEIGGYVALCAHYMCWESGAPYLLINLGGTAFPLPFY